MFRFPTHGWMPSIYKDTIDLHAIVTIGASGAPTLTNTRGGIASISRSATGTYVLTLRTSASAVLDFDVGFEYSSEVPLYGQITTKDLSESARTITFKTFDQDGNSGATDPTDGCTMRVRVRITNSSLSL